MDQRGIVNLETAIKNTPIAKYLVCPFEVLQPRILANMLDVTLLPICIVIDRKLKPSITCIGLRFLLS